MSEFNEFFGCEAFDLGIESKAKPQPQMHTLETKELPLIVLDGRNQPYCQMVVRANEDGSKVAKAYLQDEILDVDEYVELIDFLLTATEQDKAYLYIDSPGGHISAGSIISSAIAVCRGEVYTVARGLCASAACLIHNAAKPGHAIVDPMGVLMIHFSSHMDAGLSSQIMQRAADQSRYVQETLLSQALELGYLLPAEMESIKTGAEIFISAKDFAARLEAKQNGGTEPEPVEGVQGSTIPHDELSEPSGEEKPLAGTESFGAEMLNPALLARQERMLKANALRIRTTDKKNFRIYMPSDLCFTRAFVSNLEMFLDSRNPDETVTFVLGAKIADDTAPMVGAIISAISTCKAKVLTLAAGYCSIPETMIWCFGHERKVLRYGALTFGLTDVVKRVPKYLDYFTVFTEKAKELNLLTEEEAKAILENNQTVFKTHRDLLN